MGGSASTPKSITDVPYAPTTTTAPPAYSTAALTNHTKNNKELLHLILAFFVGVLLTVLLTGFVFLIIKSYRKCKVSPEDGAALLSLPWRTVSYGSLQFPGRGSLFRFSRQAFSHPRGGAYLCQHDFRNLRKKEQSLECKLFGRLGFHRLYSS
ncbi:transmembrane protein C1orf162 homolog isoform X1 [Dasypus novemcinctus]|uniref:transmembrane protein C1orf162 homolog isoform X1 n=1 Tax=Dasypus novemcinctus TaxID=9361 RepID=UPI002660117E|nr:transmembrane protein C1orf162 homolog isoform X1 [Dasypus novemcinctus]XP_058159032.1 transmembrane protein C1orf162 homolog isoform X1 [Dasypus novemcinctus]